MENTLKIGSKVMWRGAWGFEPAEETTIESIELCENGDKYGVPIDDCNEDNYLDCVFNLSNGHWCYGDQIDWDDSLALNNN